MDDDKIIYVADTGNNRIVEWYPGATNGQIFIENNEKRGTFYHLNQPADITVDKRTNSLIVCDQKNKRIIRWYRQSIVDPKVLIENIFCSSLIIGDSDLYVFDLTTSEARKWFSSSSYGKRISVNNYPEEGFSPYPSDIEREYYDMHQPVYLFRDGTTRLMKWINNVNVRAVVNNSRNEIDEILQISYFRGPVVDRLGTLYAVDRINHRIVRWLKGDTQGSTIIGGNGKGKNVNQLDNPCSLSFDLDGNIYVTDTGNHRVQRFNIVRNT